MGFEPSIASEDNVRMNALAKSGPWFSEAGPKNPATSEP
jgi:hypothetical protein